MTTHHSIVCRGARFGNVYYVNTAMSSRRIADSQQVVAVFVMKSVVVVVVVVVAALVQVPDTQTCTLPQV